MIICLPECETWLKYHIHPGSLDTLMSMEDDKVNHAFRVDFPKNEEEITIPFSVVSFRWLLARGSVIIHLKTDELPSLRACSHRSLPSHLTVRT